MGEGRKAGNEDVAPPCPVLSGRGSVLAAL